MLHQTPLKDCLPYRFLGPGPRYFDSVDVGMEPGVCILSNTSGDCSEHSQIQESVHGELRKCFNQGRNTTEIALERSLPLRRWIIYQENKLSQRAISG